MKIELPKNKKLVNIAWRDNNIWVLTKNANPRVDTAETYEFTEKSMFSVAEGKVIIIENIANN